MSLDLYRYCDCRVQKEYSNLNSRGVLLFKTSRELSPEELNCPISIFPSLISGISETSESHSVSQYKLTESESVSELEGFKSEDDFYLVLCWIYPLNPQV